MKAEASAPSPNMLLLFSILQLRKICNHPSLIGHSPDAQPPIPDELLNSTLEEQGSKLAVVSYLLHNLRVAGSEKIILVSISTQVLDLLGELCRHYEYPFLRLDGSTSANQRQGIVNRFNASYGKDFVLLLSSKAGGTGLNLIGASRILLYDMDWNPAHDIQGEYGEIFFRKMLLWVNSLFFPISHGKGLEGRPEEASTSLQVGNKWNDRGEDISATSKYTNPF